MRRGVGVLLAWFARLWLATLRVTVHGAGGLDAPERGPWVLTFFHGTQLLLHGLGRSRRTCVMVSHSRDGDLQAAALSTLGFEVVRGSSSRGGARALRAMVHRLREPGTDAVFAVDGPRGPYGSVKPGALAAARRSGARVVPAGAAARHAWVLSRAWDRFVLPWPFSSVHIVLGEPFDGAPDANDRLGRTIAECNRLACELAGVPR